MSEVPHQHRQQAPRQVRCAVVTVSDTRTPETDSGGRTIVELLSQAGHLVTVRQIIRDEPGLIRDAIIDLCQGEEVDAILLTGGTGLSSRDQTYETISPLLGKVLPGYGELLRMLSYQQIGPAAMLSRAFGGVIGRTIVLTMPGSEAAVRLAMEKIILPELGHLVREARR